MLPLFMVFILCESLAANYQDCGTRYALNRFEPAISHGGKTLRSEFPWHVALYKQYSNEESPEYICGGSIVHPKVILTAAHCIYNETYSGIDNATFIVVAGKYYVSWQHSDPGEQRLKVIEIKIPTTYVGFTNRYAEDIALLSLNTTINYTTAILPVCIDWSSKYLAEQLPTLGTVVGWGRTENKTTSEELQMANLKYIGFKECRDRIPSGFSFFVTSDKFCAGLDNGTAVQRGDSGGGITFPQSTTDNKEQYYLYGIVSIKDTHRGNIAAFTDIRKHLNWFNNTLLSIIDPGLFEIGCPPFPSNSVSLVECNLNGTSVDCNRSAKLGTNAKLQCKSSYHQTSLFKLYAETECSEGLKWSPLPESCIDCGKRYRFNSIVPLVKYKPRTVSEYPWHVALFKKSDSEEFNLICGATIIHPKAVITAAHCVHRINEEGRLAKKKELMIAAGKFKSSWNEKESAEQRLEVKMIYIKDTYKKSLTYYQDDIAILELNGTISLSDYIMPVCIDWEGKLELYGNPLIFGTAPGWGLTEENKISNELRSSKLSYLDGLQCSKMITNLVAFITPDKFCTASADGTLLQKGDSGGALTFPYYNSETGKESNFIYGIISLKVNDDLILCTNVTYHLEWIKSTLVSIINNKVS